MLAAAAAKENADAKFFHQLYCKAAFSSQQSAVSRSNT
jgi:hypothetical protein